MLAKTIHDTQFWIVVGIAIGVVTSILLFIAYCVMDIAKNGMPDSYWEKHE